MLGNSIKMAFKSLWASKMRTFLTMLGVIIGVTTVALLTTVSNGATQSIMDALGKESRLITMLTPNKEFKIADLDKLVGRLEEDEKNGDFIYTAVAKGDVQVNKASEKLKSEHEGQKVVLRIGGTVHGVDANFKNVRNLKINGRFVENDNECVIDSAFIKAYLKSKPDSEVLGSNVYLGGKITKYNYTFTTSNYDDIAEFHKELVKMCENYRIGAQPFDESLIQTVAGGYSYSSWIDPIATLDPESLLPRVYEHMEELTYEFAEGYTVEVSETFEGGREYTIVGILVEEDAALMGSGDMSGMSSAGGALGALAEYSKLTQGNVYVALTDANAYFFEDAASLSEIKLNGVYFLFDSEDVIDNASISIGTVMMQEFSFKLFEDFMIIPMKTVSQIMGTTMDIMTILLTVIASISLIIGGIGIMNIMLVAVTERTREIGIRKAIGAKKSSIRLQFLIEALVVSLIGGAIGLLISFIGSIIIGSVMGIAMAMPLWVIAMSLGFCVLIGVIFGMYPAIKASNLMPIDALRHD